MPSKTPKPRNELKKLVILTPKTRIEMGGGELSDAEVSAILLLVSGLPPDKPDDPPSLVLLRTTRKAFLDAQGA